MRGAPARVLNENVPFRFHRECSGFSSPLLLLPDILTETPAVRVHHALFRTPERARLAAHPAAGFPGWPGATFYSFNSA